MVHIMVSSACCADSQGSELLYFSLPVLREPKCKLRTPILSWTFKLHLLETWYISRFWYDPPRKEAVGDSSLQASELPHAAKSLTPGTCSMTPWCPNSWCRYWCSWLSNKTFWFSACEYQPLSQQLICTIHPFKRRWNQLQLPVAYMCYSWWDNPISKIPPDHIQKPLSNQHIIKYDHDHPGFLGGRTRTPTFHISQELYALTSV